MEFEKCKADILGGFLDTLVKALKVYPSTNPKGLFRMADFTRWGCAISVALGYTVEDFISSYEKKVKAQIEEAVYASPVGTVFMSWMEGKEDWEGKPTDLYSALLVQAKVLGISTRQKGWPKAPHILVRQINDLMPSLKSLGWEITSDRTATAKKIWINTVTSVTPAPKTKDIKDTGDMNVNAKTEDIGDILKNVKDWCYSHRNDRDEINLIELSAFAKDFLKVEPSVVVRHAMDRGILTESPKPGMAVVVV